MDEPSNYLCAHGTEVLRNIHYFYLFDPSHSPGGEPERGIEQVVLVASTNSKR